MTQEEISQASREELIELVLSSEARREELEQQLRWFKKQLFGTKSERRPRVSDDASQLCLGEIRGEGRAEAETKVSTVRAHQRRKSPKAQVREELGLCFDDSVPVKTILVPNPELDGLDEDELENVTEKVTYRFAQEAASYAVLKIVRKVVKRKDTEELSCPPAPPKWGKNGRDLRGSDATR